MDSGIVLRVMTESAWGFALGVSMAAHAAVVLAPQVLRADPLSSASNETLSSPPIEVELDAVEPANSAEDEPLPLPNRVDPMPARAPARNAAPKRAVDPAPTSASASGAAVATTAAPEMPHFTISLSPLATSAHEAAPAANEAPGPAIDPDTTFAERSVDVPARLLHGETPNYPSAARADGLEGDVQLELVLSRAGEVESARITQPIGHGLDEAALDAARAFRFEPAVKEGRPVRVRVSWTMQFRLR